MIATKFETAEARWSGVGPYYAMFPREFARRVVQTYSDPGDTIIDPFAGRGTSLYSAAISGRHGVGVEINPVGWVYAAAKLGPAESWRVKERVNDVGALAHRFRKQAKTLPEFFRHCFCPEVLEFLLAARSHLDWRNSVADRTLMAILLIDLHGKREIALSNQMRQTKAVAPDYAISWWKARGLLPPELDPVAFVLKKMKWRYAKGRPEITESRIYLGDSTHKLHGYRRAVGRLAPRGARLLFTSPPYFGVTNYHYDQWLRFWLLGGHTIPRSLRSRHRGRFENAATYRAMLTSTFTRSRDLLAHDGIVYVRTDRREATLRVTREVLAETFPKHRITRRARPFRRETQTRLFGNGAPDHGEVDLILERA